MSNRSEFLKVCRGLTNAEIALRLDATVREVKDIKKGRYNFTAERWELLTKAAQDIVPCPNCGADVFEGKRYFKHPMRGVICEDCPDYDEVRGVKKEEPKRPWWKFW